MLKKSLRIVMLIPLYAIGLPIVIISAVLEALAKLVCRIEEHIDEAFGIYD